jgi:hypothetical protein
VVNKVLEDFSGTLSGVDKITDRVFGPYDIKGRAEAVAKVTALVTYASLSEEYSKEAPKFNQQISSLEDERN